MTIKTTLLYAFLVCVTFIHEITGQRYLNTISESIIETTDIQFSSAVPQPLPSNNESFIAPQLNVKEHDTQSINLFMDTYEPEEEDIVENRAAIVLCFGGGFIQGSRKLGDVKTLALNFAKKGYFVAVIDYRLGINVLDSKASQRALYRGIQDSRTAVRFLRKNAVQYKINPTQLFIVGISSGGMIGLHNNYLDENERTEGTYQTSYTHSDDGKTYTIPDLGCLDCVGGHQGFSGRANAVVSFAGALGSLSFIDGKSNAPALLFHSEDDTTVPYDCGVPYVDEQQTQLQKVYGSHAIYQESQQKEAVVELVSSQNDGHNVHTPDGTAIYPEVLNNTSLFLHDLVQKSTTTLGSATATETALFKIFPNPVKIGQPIYISNSGTSKKLEMTWYDISGRLIFKKLIGLNNTITTFLPKEMQLQKEGVYILKTQVGGTRNYQKMVIE